MREFGMLGRRSRASTVGALLPTVTAALAAFGASSASADYTATKSGSAASFAGNADSDQLAIEPIPGLGGSFSLAHNRFALGDPGFASELDFDSADPGAQSLFGGASTAITADAGPGQDLIGINFSDLDEDRQAIVTASQLSLAGVFTIGYNASAEMAAVLSGTGDDEIEVRSTATQSQVTVESGGGTDTFTIGDGTLDGIRSGVVVGRQSGDRVVANDFSEPDPHRYRLTENNSSSGSSSLLFRDGDGLIEQSGLGTQFDLLAGTGDDRIELGNFNDPAHGIATGAGDDTVVFAADEAFSEPVAGARFLVGASGRDTLDYRAATAALPVSVDLGAKTAPAVADLIGWEQVIGGAGADRLAGDGGANLLRGAGGADRLIGDSGKDRLKGESGADRIKGGPGNDRIRDTQGRNRINCGPGKRDVAVTNEKSKVKRNCERVRTR